MYSRGAFYIKNHLHGPLQRQQQEDRVHTFLLYKHNSDAVPNHNVKFPVPFRNHSKIHWANDRNLLNVNVIYVDVILRF